MSKQGENNNKRNVLSLDALQEKHNEEFKMVENHVSLDGELLSYKMYEKFPQSLRAEYIKELVEFSFDLVNNEDMSELVDSMTVYTIISVVDKFTDLEVPEDNADKIIYAGLLSDFGILDTIMMSFEESEVEGVMLEAEKVLNAETKRLHGILEGYEKDAGELDDMSALRLVEKELENEEKLGKE